MQPQGASTPDTITVQSSEGLRLDRHGGVVRCLKALLRQKLVHHDNSRYDGYRLTPLGYDFLALKALVARGTITAVGRQIGVGKESDVFEARVSIYSTLLHSFQERELFSHFVPGKSQYVAHGCVLRLGDHSCLACCHVWLS